jgi:glycosyltransferase involved in cell wall biosynthesis
VDFEHFARPAAAPADYDRVPRPIAVYLGRLAEWFDWRLLGDVASRLPEVSFVLVGPGRPPRGAPRPPNLHLLGPRPYASAPAYLQHADVGLMPFDVSGHPRIGSSQPLKLLQYLASGLPVVSTAWAELSRLEAPAVLCRSAEEFAAGVRRCLAQPRAVDSWRAYAAGHAWEDRARRLVEILEL